MIRKKKEKAMIKPEPYRAKCQKCGHKKTIEQKSDVLNPTLWFCPKCGGNMEKTEEKGIGEIIKDVIDVFGKK